MGSLYCQCDSSPENTSPLSLESSGSVLYITACNTLHCAWWCKARMHKALYALFLSYFEGGDLRLRQSRSFVCPDLQFRAEQASELVVEAEVGTTIEEAWRTWPRFNTFQHFPFSSRCCLNTHTDAAFHSHPAHHNNNNRTQFTPFRGGMMSWLNSGVSASPAGVPRTTPRHRVSSK